MQNFNWKDKYKDKISKAADAMKLIGSGNSVFIGTGCGQPETLVDALVEHSANISDVHILHFLTAGAAPYVGAKLREKFKVNTFFVADNVSDSVNGGIADYTPISLSDIPAEFESGRLAVDAALISVTPPDASGLCSLGVSVDIVKAAAANAKYVIAQVNSKMPRTLGNSFIHVNDIDTLVSSDQKVIEIESAEPDDVLSRIGQNVAKLVDDGSTIQCGIGAVSQAVAQFLKGKKDLGLHTEMFSDWIIDLIKSGTLNCSKKSFNNGKAVASFCMGSKKLYDYIDNNPFFEFYPTEYVNDPHIISQQNKMVAINAGLEVDLTGQVCADSAGYQFTGGIGGQVDFIRGAAKSRNGKAIIVLPSTGNKGKISNIVANLSEGAGVVTSRGDVHYVVTEYGVAYLHGKTIRERVLALINIAHPKFRAELMEAAKAKKYIYPDQILLDAEKSRYPEELEHYETLRNGTEIFFRPVKPTDDAAISEMLYSVSDSTAKAKYMSATKTFPHKNIQQLTNIDYSQDITIVGTVPGVSGEQIVAVAQYYLDPKSQAAEVEFLVQDEWQKKGMGTFLLAYLTQIAKKRGIKQFVAKVSPSNESMLAVFHNSGYPINTKFDGKVYHISFDLKEPSKKGKKA